MLSPQKSLSSPLCELSMFLRGGSVLVDTVSASYGPPNHLGERRRNARHSDLDALHYRGTSLIRNTPPLGPWEYAQGPIVVPGGGGAVSYERHTPVTPTASDRRRNILQRFRDFYLQAKARIWPCLSCMCHICSTAVTRVGP